MAEDIQKREVKSSYRGCFTHKERMALLSQCCLSVRVYPGKVPHETNLTSSEHINFKWLEIDDDRSTVEDKIAGNFSLTQIIILLTPVLFTTLVYTFLPPTMMKIPGLAPSSNSLVMQLKHSQY